MEPGYRPCRRRGRSRPEDARTAGAKNRRASDGRDETAHSVLDARRHPNLRAPDHRKHAWRLVQYRGLENRYVIDEATRVGQVVETPAIFVDYEWRRLDERFEDWRQARDWPKYNFNDGQHRGLPRGLRKLYEACPWAHPPHTDGTGTQASHGDNEGEGPTGAAR